MASPHIGISYDRDNCETREEDNRRIFTNVARWVFYESKQRVAKLFWRGQCVTELYLQDEGAAGSGSFKPLLYELAVPTSRYMLALGLFKSRTLVSNTHFDFQVDYLSSAIACDYPFDTPGDVVGMDLGETCQRPSDSYEGLKHPSIGLVAKTVGLVKQVADIARFPFDWFNYSADEDHDIFSVTYTGFSSVPKSLCNISARAYSEPQEKKITTPAISRSIGRLRAEITRNLQTLSWRRIDTRFNSLWCHDYFLGKSTVHFSVVSDPKPARPVLDMFLNVLAEDANQA
ncbi:hypothetical protein CAOG_00774 [Capsaspora owczarzaki ATCC 30864]|nr:hypothetical protein CAOG_00774 [Capsaspora owczarzaki ATCC 30864]|eukprot:XP_004365645.1 hypothetical protein CAOG_00774 [Capsaspora owczarzaki ATCC 30864]